MNTPNEKVYVNAIYFTEKVFNDGGSILKADVKVDELVKFLKENRTEDGRVRLVISKKKTIEEGKSTHYATLDTWVPNGQKPQVKPVSKPTKKSVEQPEEELI